MLNGASGQNTPQHNSYIETVVMSCNHQPGEPPTKCGVSSVQSISESMLTLKTTHCLSVTHNEDGVDLHQHGVIMTSMARNSENQDDTASGGSDGASGSQAGTASSSSDAATGSSQ